jgi:hypothetical protein
MPAISIELADKPMITVIRSNANIASIVNT